MEAQRDGDSDSGRDGDPLRASVLQVSTTGEGLPNTSGEATTAAAIQKAKRKAETQQKMMTLISALEAITSDLTQYTNEATEYMTKITKDNATPELVRTAGMISDVGSQAKEAIKEHMSQAKYEAAKAAVDPDAEICNLATHLGRHINTITTLDKNFRPLWRAWLTFVAETLPSLGGGSTQVPPRKGHQKENLKKVEKTGDRKLTPLRF